MILTLSELKQQFPDKTDFELSSRESAIECFIRSYTNNHFQQRLVRFYADIVGGVVQGASAYINVGDTVEISTSINNGIYTVTAITADTMTLDGDIFDCANNLFTKIIYPPDVKMGALNLLKWEFEQREKVGVKSESISRYNVTYYDNDANNTVNGYPAALMGFLKPYCKARF